MSNLLFNLLMMISLSSPNVSTPHPYDQLYDSLQGDTKPDRYVFVKGVNGLQVLLGHEKVTRKNIITIIDYSLPSTEKRLWVIDLSTKRILFHCLVAHGKNSGENIAAKFSNKPESLQSSLGFFITGDEYHGKHGRSLKLIGVEENINDAAAKRSIVIHGASYVSKDYAQKYGRLGRSFGCPAIRSGY